MLIGPSGALEQQFDAISGFGRSASIGLIRYWHRCSEESLHQQSLDSVNQIAEVLGKF
jgi:hypothetical protein